MNFDFEKIKLKMCVGGGHFLRKGVPNLQKVGVKKIANPYFGDKKLRPPWPPPPPHHHHRYTLPPKQAKIVSKSVFLNK